MNQNLKNALQKKIENVLHVFKKPSPPKREVWFWIDREKIYEQGLTGARINKAQYQAKLTKAFKEIWSLEINDAPDPFYIGKILLIERVE